MPEFSDWREGFRARAGARGIGADAIGLLDGLAPLPEVLAKDRAQAEVTLSLKAYIDRVVPAERVAAGRAALARHADLFSSISERYGVPGPVIAAVWGVESDFGRKTGEVPTLGALATLAWDGRRGAFFEAELLALLRLHQRGDVAADTLRGSWAGAFGQTQFMPSSALLFAVDWDGDGRRTLDAADPADALASAGAYLARFGFGPPVVTPVTLPADDDLGRVGQWRRDWSDLGHDGPGRLCLPAGVTGPALILGPGGAALLRYNAALPYVLAVAELAARIAEEAGLGIDWPDEPPLDRRGIAALQAALTAAGHPAGSADGLMGPDTRAAIRSYQAAAGMPADGYPSRPLLDRLQRRG